MTLHLSCYNSGMKLAHTTAECLILHGDALDLQRRSDAVRRDAEGVPTSFRLLKPGPLEMTFDGQPVVTDVSADDVRSIATYHATFQSTPPRRGRLSDCISLVLNSANGDFREPVDGDARRPANGAEAGLRVEIYSVVNERLASASANLPRIRRELGVRGTGQTTKGSLLRSRVVLAPTCSTRRCQWLPRK